jgi:type II restriction enzyme
MAFEATKREWGELYAFFRLLADGYVFAGRADGRRDEARRLPVAMVQREEHDGTRRYVIEKDCVRMEREGQEPKRFPREDFDTVSQLVWQAVRTAEGDDVTSPDGVEEFLDEVAIYDLAANTDDRTDFYVALYAEDAPLEGVSVRSMVGRQFPLLDGGRAANFKFEQSGIKFATPTVNKINAFGDTEDVAGRMMMIERLGGVLRFNDAADKVFRSNLCMIDLHFPRMAGEMVRLMQLDGLTKVSELTEAVKALNPLKIKEELITKHGYYEYKMKQFLMAVALGMRPAKLFNGTDSAVGGFMVVGRDGRVLMFSKNDREEFADYLYHNTRLEKGSVEKDKYGFLERENGVYYFKLNVKVGLLKRK